MEKEDIVNHPKHYISANGMEVIDVGLLLPGCHRKDRIHVVVFLTMHHAVPFSQHPAHCGLSGIRRAIDEITVFQVML